MNLDILKRNHGTNIKNYSQFWLTSILHVNRSDLLYQLYLTTIPEHTRALVMSSGMLRRDISCRFIIIIVPTSVPTMLQIDSWRLKDVDNQSTGSVLTTGAVPANQPVSGGEATDRRKSFRRKMADCPS